MKVLLFDIETAPSLGYTWGKYEQTVLDYTKEGYMLSFAYKWLGKKQIHVHGLSDFKLYKSEPDNDRELVKRLWEILNEADIVVGHNGDKFDLRKSNTFFAKHGLTPPSPYKTVDTLKVARKYFYFNSNRLDDLGNYLGLGRKVETGGFNLWKKCMAGQPRAWRLMKQYNKQDVALLEKVYNRFLPWINMNLLEENKCPNCGSEKVQSRGVSRTLSGVKQRFQCQACGKWSTGRLTDKPQILR